MLYRDNEVAGKILGKAPKGKEYAVQNGGEAMSIYPKMAAMTPEEREHTRKALLDYCCLDTFAMVKVWEKLLEVTK